ncbi:MAG: hypothetical protein KJ006_06085, partial [Thermoleophilia bacterium]|nr:hypothetical protein [Thermoleophilia bacterium]
MPTQTSTLDKAKKLIEDRLKELDEERKRLEKALSNLIGHGGGRRASGASAIGTGGRPRRRRKGGTRAEHAMKAVREQPGITAGEIAKKLKIKPNYVYRVMADL